MVRSSNSRRGPQTRGADLKLAARISITRGADLYLQSTVPNLYMWYQIKFVNWSLIAQSLQGSSSIA